jgi:hypothetical protein
VRVFQKLAAMKLTCERLVDLATGEVEAGQVSDGSPYLRRTSGLVELETDRQISASEL